MRDVPDRQPHSADQPKPGEHHVTVPNHDPLRIGTLAAILDSVAAHHGLTRETLLLRLLE